MIHEKKPEAKNLVTLSKHLARSSWDGALEWEEEAGGGIGHGHGL
jgi:hypothetical protein